MVFAKQNEMENWTMPIVTWHKAKEEGESLGWNLSNAVE
jgi:hypothetical protein